MRGREAAAATSDPRAPCRCRPACHACARARLPRREREAFCLCAAVLPCSRPIPPPRPAACAFVQPGRHVRAPRTACMGAAQPLARGMRAGVRSLLDRCCCLRFSTRISLLSSQSQPSSERWNGGLVQLSCSMRWPHASWPVTGLGAFGPFYLVPCGGVSWVGLGLGSDKSAVR